MLVPALQHGDWKDVRKRVSVAVRRIVKGEGFLDVVTEGGMIDTAATQAVLVVNGTLRAQAPPAIYCAEPWKHLLDATSVLEQDVGDAIEEQVFHASLTTSWGVLGLMSPGNTLWLSGRPQWEAPFMRAALAAWDEIDAVGARYYNAFAPERLWSIHNTLKHVLARAGVPGELLRAPLPAGGPAALLKYAVHPN